MAFQTPLCIEQIVSEERFLEIESGVRNVLSSFESVLMDDYQARQNPESLLENVKSYIPLLWVIRERHLDNAVYGIAALSDGVMGRHAFLHGASLPLIRRHPAITQAARLAIDFAFQELHVLKVKAEFRADNEGALGFCRRMGFQQEALFRDDIEAEGRLRDVVIASLPRSRWKPA